MPRRASKSRWTPKSQRTSSSRRIPKSPPIVSPSAKILRSSKAPMPPPIPARPTSSPRAAPPRDGPRESPERPRHPPRREHSAHASRHTSGRAPTHGPDARTLAPRERLDYLSASPGPLAQLDRASASGAEGQWFESTRVRQHLRVSVGAMGATPAAPAGRPRAPPPTAPAPPPRASGGPRHPREAPRARWRSQPCGRGGRPRSGRTAP